MADPRLHLRNHDGQKDKCHQVKHHGISSPIPEHLNLIHPTVGTERIRERSILENWDRTKQWRWPKSSVIMTVEDPKPLSWQKKNPKPLIQPIKKISYLGMHCTGAVYDGKATTVLWMWKEVSVIDIIQPT